MGLEGALKKADVGLKLARTRPGAHGLGTTPEEIGVGSRVFRGFVWVHQAVLASTMVEEAP
jgi:hypothetical protein